MLTYLQSPTMRPDELATRRCLLQHAERGDRRALAMLRSRYRLLFWAKHGRTILT